MRQRAFRPSGECAGLQLNHSQDAAGIVSRTMEGNSAETAHELAAARLPAQISIVVPTFNERDNVPELIERLRAAMGRLAWEVVFVDDDSKDGTLRALSAAASDDPRVRFL